MFARMLSATRGLKLSFFEWRQFNENNLIKYYK